MCQFDMGRHEGLWVEVQEVKIVNIEMQKVLHVCVREEKSWNIEPNKQKSVFNLFLSLMWHLKMFQYFVKNALLGKTSSLTI